MSEVLQSASFGDAIELIDTEYYQVARPGSMGERLLIAARDRIYADFVRICAPRPGDSILDVGVSDVVTDGANVIERLYPYPEAITAAGLGAGHQFRAAYPRVRYDRVYAGEGLPYGDRQFRVAVSNAVLEHVGSPTAQVSFIRELTRVADRVFLTVPNRFFPVEHHTAIPFAHWMDRTFGIACRALRREEWLQPENLILMSHRRLQSLAPRGPQMRVKTGMSGIPFGPFSSNVFMFISQVPARG